MNDFALALAFWLLYEAVSLPLRWALTPFSLSGDLRRTLSRIGGPPLTILVVGFAAHGFIDLGPLSGWLIICFCGVGALTFALYAGGPGILRTIAAESLPICRKTWRRDLVLELTFLLTFVGYVAFRRLAPEMTFEIQNSGAEKFANAMLFWSCWHAKDLPPEDYWFSGLPQTYYYWGHFFWSWLGRLGGFPASVVISLSLARVVTLTGEAAYLLLRSFRLSWRTALLGSLVIAWGGNPQAWLTFKSQYDAQQRFAEAAPTREESGLIADPIRRVSQALRDHDWESYSFWEPSRVIEGTVTEFPAWSAILGDFHAHHLALPWLIGWFAVLLGGDRWFLRSPSRVHRASRLGVASLLFAGLGSLACLANVWSLPVVLVGSSTVLLWRGGRGKMMEFIAPLCLLAILMGVAFFLSGSHPLAALGQAGGGAGEPVGLFERLPVKLLPGALRSSTGELVALWGFQVGFIVLATGAALTRRWRSRGFVCWLFAGALFLIVGALLQWDQFAGRDEPALYWLGLGCWAVGLTRGRRGWIPLRAGIAGAASCLLLAGLEFFYVQDRMTGELARYNSYFKFSYAAWPLLTAVAFACAAKVAMLPGGRFTRWGLRAALSLFLPPIMGMWILGGPARILQARIGDDRPREATLNAFTWLEGREAYRSDADALAWIRVHVAAGEVIAEAPSNAGYSYQGRVASLAGRPIPLGWGHHEAQWRGASIYERLARRHESVNKLYLAPDADVMTDAAVALNIRWAILGKAERDKYGEADFEAALSIMKDAASLRASFPEGSPRTYLFEFASEPKDGSEGGEQH